MLSYGINAHFMHSRHFESAAKISRKTESVKA